MKITTSTSPEDQDGVITSVDQLSENVGVLCRDIDGDIRIFLGDCGSHVLTIGRGGNCWAEPLDDLCKRFPWTPLKQGKSMTFTQE